MKDRFLASVSHELRTPMTIILGFTGGLLRGAQGPLAPPQHESLERVQRNAKLLLELINNVLDISKIEAGKMEVKLSPVSLRTIVRQAEADYGEAARKKGIAFRGEVAPGLDVVTTDGEKISQLLANLVGNALKFAETGTILARAEPDSGARKTVLVVDDDEGVRKLLAFELLPFIGSARTRPFETSR